MPRLMSKGVAAARGGGWGVVRRWPGGVLRAVQRLPPRVVALVAVVVVGVSVVVVVLVLAQWVATALLWLAPARMLATEWVAAPADDADAAPTVDAGVAPRLPVVFVTGSSANHFALSVLLLHSIFVHEATPPHVLYYDLGLTPDQAAWLRATPGVRVRRFPFERMPPHFAMQFYSFAWKPTLLADVLEHEAEAVVWLDAGDRLQGPASTTVPLTHVHTHGFLSRPSGGRVRDLTHPGTLAALGVSAEDAVLDSINCDASFLVLTRNATLDALVRPWRACAMEAVCIAPPGSSTRNHRQDQAVLSVLVAQRARTHGFTCEYMAAMHAARTTQNHCEDHWLAPHGNTAWDAAAALARYRVGLWLGLSFLGGCS
jgi:hypothetical protein